MAGVVLADSFLAAESVAKSRVCDRRRSEASFSSRRGRRQISLVFNRSGAAFRVALDVIRVWLRLAAGSLSFFWRAPLAVGERDVAACSGRGGWLSARAPASCRSAAASISCYIRLVM